MALQISAGQECSGHSVALSVSSIRSWSKDRRSAWSLWALFLIAIWLVIAWGSTRSVTPAYSHGAAAWLAGTPLYSNDGTGFIYLPQAAVLFLPFAMLPTLAADLLWRCFTIGCFAWGVYRLTQMAEKDSRVPMFGLVSAITIPMAWSSGQNGQATLPMAGLMMAAVCDMSARSWWRAAGCLAFAVALKPLAIVLILLAAVVYRPMIGRLAVALAVAFAFPFLAQDFSYVLGQYLDFMRMTGLASDHSRIVYFAQAFGLLRVVGWDVAAGTQTVVRLAFAGLTLVACLWSARRLDVSRWSVYFYTLSGCYLVLFNPRTENNTYSLLAPAVAIFLAQEVLVERRPLRVAVLAICALGILGTYEIGRLVTSPAHSVWLAPLMAIVFTTCVVRDLVRNERITKSFSSSEPAAPLSLRASA